MKADPLEIGMHGRCYIASNEFRWLEEAILVNRGSGALLPTHLGKKSGIFCS